MSTPIVPDPDSPRQLSLLDPVEIPLTKGYVALVDPADVDLAAYNWFTCAKRNGRTCYAARQIRRNGKQFTQQMHCVILARILGRSIAREEQVDHIDGNGLNNRRANLRLASRAQNGQNRKLNRNNSSGYKGVSYHKTNKKWQARIYVERKLIYLGYFDNPEDAHKAYCAAAKHYHREFARVE